ncbi:MAG: hypothetical protein SGPRY_003603 [Prymnesium sp.]
MVTETDHMFMAPPPNDATERRPVGFKFYYMTAMDAKLKPVVTKFLAPGIDPSTVDQASRATLRPVASTKHCPRFSVTGRVLDAHDIAAQVLEMWGYNIAARNMGIRHLDWQDLQVSQLQHTFVECGRRRRREHSHVWRPVPPTLCRDERSKGLGISSECAHIAHAHSARDAEGGPLFQVEGDTEEGSLNDRAQMTDRMLPHLAVFPGSLGEANTSFVAELAGSGPWRWGSSGPFAFLRGGILLTPWGVGLWGVQRSTPDGSTELARPNQVFADFAGSFHTLSWFSRECLRLTSTRKADGDKVFCPLRSPDMWTAAKLNAIMLSGCRLEWNLRKIRT